MTSHDFCIVTGVSVEWVGDSFTSLRATVPEVYRYVQGQQYHRAAPVCYKVKLTTSQGFQKWLWHHHIWTSPIRHHWSWKFKWWNRWVITCYAWSRLYFCLYIIMSFLILQELGLLLLLLLYIILLFILLGLFCCWLAWYKLKLYIAVCYFLLHYWCYRQHA